MSAHPTKEQVDAAKAWFGPRGEYLSQAQCQLLNEWLEAHCSVNTHHAAGEILAAALASAERDAERFRSHIRRITERHCDCGGAPAGDSGCVACRIYHELNAAVGKEAE